ncbi:MAG: hypothetical protein MUE34_02915 [Acidimicrobiales bacterium]|nr:hypothetical protein [Acidimicrobiales bacterium]
MGGAPLQGTTGPGSAPAPRTPPVFFCPTCGGDRRYERRPATVRWRVRRRSDVPQPDAVVCTGCATEHHVVVLLEPTNATILEATALALRHGVIAVLRADPRPAPDPRLPAVDLVVGPFGYPGLGPASLAEGLRTAGPEAVDPACVRAGRMLAPPGRRAVLHACLQVACIDGPPTAVEALVLRRIAIGLGCPGAEIDHLLRDAGHRP